MRARGIKPGFFINGDLVQLPALTRILFVGLWCMADRKGRLKDEPFSIKLAVLPGDECDIDRMLGDLAGKGFIVRYETDGHRYIQVLNFDKHQTPHVKERESTIPAPDLHQTSTVQTQVLHPLTPDSGLLTPDSIEKHTVVGSTPADAVFEYWKAAMGRNGATNFDDKRKKVVKWALKTYGVETCLSAIDGYAASDFHMGRDPASGGKKNNDLTLIFRDATHAERFLDKPPSALEEIDRIWGHDEN